MCACHDLSVSLTEDGAQCQYGEMSRVQQHADAQAWPHLQGGLKVPQPGSGKPMGIHKQGPLLASGDDYSIVYADGIPGQAPAVPLAHLSPTQPELMVKEIVRAARAYDI